ncbi:MAG: hypothetical protein JSW03_07400 [Candidatus Eiseniibacteriota bacterium]|nr:MAG: hypothetical protein JSW03_07400 [Candidatus Eisenbacteria bacterium]
MMRKTCCAATLLLAILVSLATAGQENEQLRREKTLTDVMSLLARGDSFQAAEYVNRLGSPEEVASAYVDLVKDLYWKQRAVSHMVTMAKAGILYCLTMALEADEQNPELAVELRSAAKTNAANLASFTWPGWDEDGITIEEADMEAGLDAARLNLRLAKQLGKDALRVSTAYWTLGAQCMAASRHDEALEAFFLSKETAREAREPLYELLASGYVGLAKMVEGRRTAEGRRDFNDAVEQLGKLESDDAQFFVQQLKTALEVFSQESD